MHTARLLTVSPSMHCSGGCLLWGVSAPGGSALAGGAWSRGVVPGPGGVCCRGCLLQGVPGPGGVVSQHALRQTPPHCEQNSLHTLLKILPCPKLRLRAVIIHFSVLTNRDLTQILATFIRIKGTREVGSTFLALQTRKNIKLNHID